MDVLRRSQLTVEPAREGTAVIRVAGELNGALGPRLGRLLDAMATGTHRVLVDLANVRAFEVEGVRVLRVARDRLDETGVRLVLSGLAGHRSALPGLIEEALAGLDTVAELEEATG